MRRERSGTARDGQPHQHPPLSPHTRQAKRRAEKNTPLVGGVGGEMWEGSWGECGGGGGGNGGGGEGEMGGGGARPPPPNPLPQGEGECQFARCSRLT